MVGSQLEVVQRDQEIQNVFRLGLGHIVAQQGRQESVVEFVEIPPHIVAGASRVDAFQSCEVTSRQQISELSLNLSTCETRFGSG